MERVPREPNQLQSPCPPGSWCAASSPCWGLGVGQRAGSIWWSSAPTPVQFSQLRTDLAPGLPQANWESSLVCPCWSPLQALSQFTPQLLASTRVRKVQVLASFRAQAEKGRTEGDLPAQPDRGARFLSHAGRQRAALSSWHGPSREQGDCLKLILQRFTPTACSPAEQVLASWQLSPRACRNRLHCRALAQQRRGTARLTRALGVCTPRHWHPQNTPRTEPSSGSKVERGGACIAGCTWKVTDTRENRGEDNPKSPVQVQGGQPAGPRARAVSLLSQTQPPQRLPSQLSPPPHSRYLFPDAKPPEELLLQTASSPWVLGRVRGYASTKQTQLLLPPQPQPGLVHALPTSQPGAAKAGDAEMQGESITRRVHPCPSCPEHGSWL